MMQYGFTLKSSLNLMQFVYWDGLVPLIECGNDSGKKNMYKDIRNDF